MGEDASGSSARREHVTAPPVDTRPRRRYNRGTRFPPNRCCAEKPEDPTPRVFPFQATAATPIVNRDSKPAKARGGSAGVRACAARKDRTGAGAVVYSVGHGGAAMIRARRYVWGRPVQREYLTPRGDFVREYWTGYGHLYRTVQLMANVEEITLTVGLSA